MSNFQKIGGYAAWAEALCYIAGFIVFIFFLDFPSWTNPAESLAYYMDNKALILGTMSLIYVLASLVLAVLVVALHERLKDNAPNLMKFATAIGLIWAGVVVASGMIFIVAAESAVELFESDPDRAASLWQISSVIENGLGGGIELLGGIWIFCVSWAALKGRQLSKFLNWLGFFVGVAGILTVFPPLFDLVDVFGLSQIIWFIWVGAIMVRRG